jgi:NTE family protein
MLLNLFKIFYMFFSFTSLNAFSLNHQRLFERKIDNNKYNFDFSCSDWDGKIFNTLIFEGGGVRAVVYSGAIRKLEEENVIKDIKNLGGTSSGAQTAALLCSGYTSPELEDALRNAPWNKILNGKIFSFRGLKNLFTKYGISDSNYLREYLDYLIYLKTGKRNITFLELYNYSQIHLKIGVCSLKDQEFKYIDYLNYPDMPVSLGLTGSSCIPFIFTSVKWEDDILIDGGLVGNLPITAFPKDNCLAFNLIDNNEIIKNKKKPGNIFIFIKNILLILLKNSQKFYSSKNPCIKNIDFIEIHTDNVSVLDENMSNETINILINHGYKATEHFFDTQL